MGLFNGLDKVFDNLFSIQGNGWVQRIGASTLDLEMCNGVARLDENTKTCELCVALNKTIWKNQNKPTFHHYNCRCKHIQANEPNIVLDFPIDKITKYLFVEQNKKRMMRSFGYEIEDSEYLYSIISRAVEQEFLSGKYILKNLDLHGQRVQINFSLNGKKEYVGQLFDCFVGCVAWQNGKIKVATPLVKKLKGESYEMVG